MQLQEGPLEELFFKIPIAALSLFLFYRLSSGRYGR